MINSVQLPIATGDFTGDWKVSQFSDNNHDETSDFTGITVRFTANNQFLIFENDIQQSEELWSIKHDDGMDKLSISISSSVKPFSQLDNDWMVTSKSSNSLTLHDDNTYSEEMMRLERL